VFVII